MRYRWDQGQGVKLRLGGKTMPDFKTVVLRDGCLHVETPLGIVNIRVGLSDIHGRRVDSIETIPNAYAGERVVRVRGYRNTRMVELKHK